MVGMEKVDIKLGSISKSAKHEALEKVLETEERISNRIKNIYRMLEKEKLDKIKVNESGNSR
jgi:ferritin